MVSEFPPRHGGISDYTADLTKFLSRDGVQVSVLTFEDPQGPRYESLPSGVAVYRSVTPGLRSGISSIKLARQLQPDLVHIQLTTFLFDRSFYVFPLLHDSAPLLLTVHEAPASYRTIHMIPFVRWALRKSRRIISLSDHVRDILVSFHGIASGKIARVPLGIDLVRFNPTHRTREARKRLGWDGKFVLLMAGFLNPGKGVHTFLRAAALMGIPDLHVVVAGEFTESSDPSLTRHAMNSYEQYIRAEIARLGLADSVEMRGYVPERELPLLMANSDAFVLPYAYSYQSLSLDLAMASGCPVVASDIPAFRELVVDEETGLLVEVDDPEDLVGKLRWLYDNPARARGLGQAAREVAERAFDPSVAGRMHTALYREVLTQGET